MYNSSEPGRPSRPFRPGPVKQFTDLPFCKGDRWYLSGLFLWPRKGDLMYGYAGKLLFVDLSKKTCEVKALDEDIAKNYIGGPSLGAKILYDNMPANTDVFSEDSMVGFVSGPLNNTPALFGGRYTVVSKSPVTGGWNDSNSGGFFGPSLKKAGFDAVFVKGISEEPVYIYIEDGKACICDASQIWGKTTKETENWLKEKHGDKINAALIGPAGENMSLIASVMNDTHRAAGRGGSAAVIGSKKLKALVVKGDMKTEVFDRDAVMELNKLMMEVMKGPGAGFAGGFGTYGSGVGFTGSTLSGDAGVKNWSGSGVADYPEDIANPVGSIGLDQYKVKKYNCSNCPLGCGAHLSIPDDRWDLSDSPRPEYETQGAFGSLLLNPDPKALCRCNNICNEYGLDTISTGSTIAWAMECFNEGVLTKEELDGIELKWGDPEAIVALCEKIAKNEGVGAVLAKGSREACRILGKGEQYLVVASGIEEPQHDSRLAWGLARTYQYDPTPGRHVKGGLGMAPCINGFDYDSTGPKDRAGVVDTEIMNASGYCLFGNAITPPGHKVKLFSAVTGFEYSESEAEALGLRSFNMRHAFNLREGFKREDFTLSERYTKSPLPATGPLANITVDAERIADNFFDAMEWDKESLRPSKKMLEEIGGMEKVVEDLY